jgi:integrase
VKPQDIDLTEGVIDIKTQKTDELVSIPIFPITRAILSKYEGKTENSLPASISNQKFNAYLKEIGQRFIPLQSSISQEYSIDGKKVIKNLQKWQLLTTHTARRSFATNMYLKGLRIETIRKVTGHKSEAQFLKYLKMSPRENARVMKREWESTFAVNQ